MIVFILKKLLVLVLKSLESKYPGLSIIVDKVISLIDGGATTPQINAHLDALRK